jgi:predicted LPLAT superfamily acyltransferase
MPDPAPLAEPRSAAWIGKREHGSMWLLHLMVFVSLRVGRGLSRCALFIITLYFFLFLPDARQHSLRYLQLALGRNPSARERFRHLFYFATCIHDRVYLIDDQYERFDITIEGESFVRAQLQAGNGGFLLGAHMGSFEMMRSVGRRQPGLNVSMAMYEHNAPKIKAIFAAINPATAPDIIALGQVDAMLQIAERLARGAFVGMLGDRTLADEPVQATRLLGEPVYLPTGPMRAAAILRCPVIFMLGLYRGGNHYHVVFAPVADFSATPADGRNAAVSAAIERYAALLDRYCRSDPYNWFNFFDFWRARNDESAA